MKIDKNIVGLIRCYLVIKHRVLVNIKWFPTPIVRYQICEALQRE